MEITVAKPKSNLLTFTWITTGLGILFILSYLHPNQGPDWSRYYLPALKSFLQGESPYIVEGVFNPPWTFILLSPLAFMPPKIAAAVMSVASMSAFAYAVHRFKVRPIVAVLFLLSPNVLWASYLVSVDWLVVLGLFMPPWLGLFFVLIKPQIGLGIALYWFVDAYRIGGIKRVCVTFAPVTIALAVSILIYGRWFSDPSYVVFGAQNAGTFPHTLPVAFALLAWSIRSRDIRPALASTAFLSPYIATHSWAIPVLALLSMPLESVAAIIGLWIMWIIKGRLTWFLM